MRRLPPRTPGRPVRNARDPQQVRERIWRSLGRVQQVQNRLVVFSTVRKHQILEDQV